MDLVIPAHTRDTLLVAQLSETIQTLEGAAEEMAALRETRVEDELWGVRAGDVRGCIATLREDLAALEAVLPAA